MAGRDGAGPGEAGPAGDRRLILRRRPTSPSGSCRRALLALLAASLATAPLGGQQPDSTSGPDPAAAPDAVPLLRTGDLAPAAAFAGSLLLVEPLEGFEEELRRDATPSDGLDGTLADAGAVAGDGLVNLGLTAGAWALGEATGSEGLARVGRRATGALAAAGMLEVVFKAAIGRSRPTVSADSDVFHPLSLDRERHAFPSGHAAHAFAVATTLDRELDAAWVPWAAYPTAGLVAASRVAGREHWATDVVAGAALGVFAARLAGRVLNRISGKARPLAVVAGDRLLLGLSLRAGGRGRP